MADPAATVRSMWTPLRDLSLLLPSVSVAEVVNYQVPEDMPGAPEWILGTIRWRERTLPVLSLEVLCGQKDQANLVYSRLLIVNSIRPGSPVPFYAVVATGLPRLLQFGGDTAVRVEAAEPEALQCRVTVNGETAVIPDLDFIQRQLEEHGLRAA